MSTPELHLAAFFQAATDAEADRPLDALVTSLKPAMEQVIARRGFTGCDAEDALGDARVLLLSRLRTLREAGVERAIGNPAAYARQVAASVCVDRLKAASPRRAKVQRRLVDLLANQTGQRGFDLWSGSSGERWCGFAVWKRETGRPGRSFHGAAQEIAWQALPGEDPKAVSPAVLVAGLLRWAGGPVLLDDLVPLVAELWDERDLPPAIGKSGNGEGDLEAVPAPGPDPGELVSIPEVEAERSRFLQSLWAEIEALPERQRAALLLNLRDREDGNILSVFKACGIVSYRKMAEALGVPVESFLELLRDLPLDDLRIAARLGCGRQEVINLRKSARARLARRLKLGWSPNSKNPPGSPR